jgi:hypothetical protein
VHSLPQFKLPNQEEQKKYCQTSGTAKILQILQKENFAQRNKVRLHLTFDT